VVREDPQGVDRYEGDGCRQLETFDYEQPRPCVIKPDGVDPDVP
jgi:hypothetical protein